MKRLSGSCYRWAGWSFVDRLLRTLPIICFVLLAACAHQGGSSRSARSYAPSRYYAPPGPPGDPWGPYIREAASRFAVPEQWVRAVMRQESGGQQQAVSPVGAMGLMQLMPATYEELRDRYGLGGDPFDPHNNLLAGTAYIRELSDRYGAPGFLAAYNAGPGRLDRYLAGTSTLPTETVNYVAAISPNLGTSVPMSGPLASYAVGRRPRAVPPTIASLAAGCDPDAAYDPDHPCRPLEVAAAAPAVPTRDVGAGGCDLDAAYDPNHPCRPVSGQALVTQAAPSPALQPVRVAGTAGDWAIQVGAFSTPDLAKAVAESARAQAPAQLGSALVSWPPTSVSGSTLYRARLVNLSANAASAACSLLNQRQLPCIVVQPSAS